MAKKVTLWEPDVCTCSVIFEYDDATGWDNINVLSNYDSGNIHYQTKLCPAHASLNIGEIHTVVWNECKMKEDARKEIIRDNPEVTEKDASTNTDVIKRDLDFNFTFTGTGKTRQISVGVRNKTGIDLVPRKIKTNK